MQRLIEIKNRIKSIADTRKITGAMETISIAKMRKAMLKYESSKLFYDKLLSTIYDVADRTGRRADPFFDDPASGIPTVYIVVASDKGMAGAYNANVFKHVWHTIAAEKVMPGVLAVGHTTREFFEKKGCTVTAELSEASFEPSKRSASQISDLALSLFKEGRAGRIVLFYTHMYENNVIAPVSIDLLPLGKGLTGPVHAGTDAATDQRDPREVSYDPSPVAVMDSLIPAYLRWAVYGALVQAAASEHYSRRLAMSNATKNAGDILEDLTVRYHRARQEAITNELNEIIAATGGISQAPSHSVRRDKPCQVRQVRPFPLRGSIKEEL